jgi:hypothetical protein
MSSFGKCNHHFAQVPMFACCSNRLTLPHYSENTFHTPYSGPEAKSKPNNKATQGRNRKLTNFVADYQQIMAILQQLENNARSSGLLSLSDNAPEEGNQEQPPPAKSLATRNSETMQAVEQNFTEQSRLVSNVQAAINTSSHRV